MADIIGGAIEKTGLGGFSLDGIFSGIGILFLGLIITAIIGAFIWWFFWFRKFKYRIKIFEQVGSDYLPTRQDKAKFVKIGNGGQKVLMTMKGKMRLPAYARQVGKNTYWFGIAPDGYWHPINPPSKMTASGGLPLESVDAGMQYQYVGLEQTIAERTDKKKDWVQVVMVLSLVTLVLVVGIIAWLWFREWQGYLGSANIVSLKLSEAVNTMDQILIRFENICSSSGLRQG